MEIEHVMSMEWHACVPGRMFISAAQELPATFFVALNVENCLVLLPYTFACDRETLFASVPRTVSQVPAHLTRTFTEAKAFAPPTRAGQRPPIINRPFCGAALSCVFIYSLDSRIQPALLSKALCKLWPPA